MDKEKIQKYIQNRRAHINAIKVLTECIGDRSGIEALKITFDESDEDGNGDLDIGEFSVMIKKYQAKMAFSEDEPELTDEEIKGVFGLFDADGDGKLSFEVLLLQCVLMYVNRLFCICRSLYLRRKRSLKSARCRLVTRIRLKIMKHRTKLWQPYILGLG